MGTGGSTALGQVCPLPCDELRDAGHGEDTGLGARRSGSGSEEEEMLHPADGSGVKR